MPWITKNGERKFEPRLPKPEITPRDPKAPWPDPEGAERLLRERAAFWKWWHRHLAEYLEIYLYCPRTACRRNKVCLPDAPCHDEAFEVLKETVYPDLLKALRERVPDEDAPLPRPLSTAHSRGRQSRQPGIQPTVQTMPKPEG